MSNALDQIIIGNFLNDNYPLAWKTGTSYGQKDGWAIGVSPEWVIGVQVGDVEGKANSNLTGSRFAGPLLFDIFNQLPKDLQSIWFDYPYYDLYPITLCSETGFTKPILTALFLMTLQNLNIHIILDDVPTTSIYRFLVQQALKYVQSVGLLEMFLRQLFFDYPVDVTSFIAKRWLIKPSDLNITRYVLLIIIQLNSQLITLNITIRFGCHVIMMALFKN